MHNYLNGSLPQQTQSRVREDESQAAQQQFFSHRLSNSNNNLKHIIKAYKDDQQPTQP